MNLHRALLLLHRWAGLVLGVVFVVLGITGSILSFQREIDAALNPALFHASGPPDPAISFSAVQRIAEAEMGHPAGTIRPPDQVWPVWVVSPPRGLRGAMTAYIDPASGAVLGRRDTSASFIGITRQLHETLLLRPWFGRDAVGWLGLLLLVMALSGIWVWWPRGGQGGLLRLLIRLRRKPTLILHLDLHRLVGIWMALVLAVVAFSGVAIIFPGWFRPLLGISQPVPPALMPRREPPLLDADAAAAAARAHAPGEVITAIQLPSRQRPAWTVMLRAEDSDPEFRVRSIITLDPWTGAVLEDRSPRSRSTAEEALALQRWLHGGAPLGMPGRLLVFLSGLTMPLLFVTGLSAWLLRRRNLRRLSLSARDAATAFPRRPA